MTESTDEILSHVCEHCGKRFYRHRYVNRYSEFGKPVPTKYCSPACRKDVHRIKKGYSRSVPMVEDTDVQARSVPPSLSLAPSSTPPLKSNVGDAFERLRGDAVLSKWKPTGEGKDVPDISDFLRR